MHITRQIARLSTTLCMLAVIVSGVQAQQQNQGQNSNQGQDQGQNPSQPQGGPTQATQPTAPIPAVHSPLASLSSVQDTTEQTMTPDTRALSGAQYLSVGGPAYSHSYWQPSVSVAFSGYSNPVIAGSGSSSGTDWSTYTTILGEVDVHKISGTSTFDLMYQGAGYLSTGGGNGSNAVAQQLALAEVLSFHRWTLSLINELGYFPQGAYGYSGLGVGIVQAPGINQGLQTGFVPSQSILTAPGQRLSEIGVVEGDLKLTPRTTLTLIGSGGILHYFDNLSLYDTNNVIASMGYNYQWTRQDTIAVFYTFGAFRYDNINQFVNSNSVQFSYARRLTGKLAFQVAGGPEWVSSTVPITSSTGEITTSTTQSNQLLWTANAALTYALRRSSLTANFYHGITGGSGVLAGSQSSVLTGSYNRQMTRLTGVSVTGGYSRNTGVSLVPNEETTIAPSQAYNYWFGGGSVTHSFGGALSMTLGYQLQYQNSNAPFCVVAPCTTSYTVNEISVSLNFHPRLIPF
jgi:hypothetical protein